MLAAYVAGTALAEDDLDAAVAAQTRAGRLHPVFAGSALTGAGVDTLLAALPTLLPSATGPVEAPVSARVFKVERGADGGKIAYLRMNAGTVRPRQRLELPGGRSGKVSVLETSGVRAGSRPPG